MTGIVECYSGHDYGERPKSFIWEGLKMEIAQIQTQWRTPSGRCFRIITKNDEKFILCYDEAACKWMIDPINGVRKGDEQINET